MSANWLVRIEHIRAAVDRKTTTERWTLRGLQRAWNIRHPKLVNFQNGTWDPTPERSIEFVEYLERKCKDPLASTRPTGGPGTRGDSATVLDDATGVAELVAARSREHNEDIDRLLREHDPATALNLASGLVAEAVACRDRLARRKMAGNALRLLFTGLAQVASEHEDHGARTFSRAALNGYVHWLGILEREVLGTFEGAEPDELEGRGKCAFARFFAGGGALLAGLLAHNARYEPDEAWIEQGLVRLAAAASLPPGRDAADYVLATEAGDVNVLVQLLANAAKCSELYLDARPALDPDALDPVVRCFRSWPQATFQQCLAGSFDCPRLVTYLKSNATDLMDGFEESRT